MNHKIDNIAQLSSDSKNLYTKIVQGSIDTMLKNLKEGITNLKGNWHGTDAGFNINNLVTVYNIVTDFRNYLAELAEFTSGISVYYNTIVAANGGVDNNLTKLTTDRTTKLDAYTDNTPGFEIKPEASSGIQSIKLVDSAFSGFLHDAHTAIDAITTNWSSGEKHDEVIDRFKKFETEATKYQESVKNAYTNVSEAYDRVYGAGASTKTN